jgi:alpha-beta hydrolase superfamily lysophospholipase
MAMSLQPKLITVSEPKRPAGVVIVLHGGASRPNSPMVSPAQLSVIRMIPIAKAIARAGRGQLAVYRLLNSSRGWDASNTPVDDARWALDEAVGRVGPDVPAALVGHSLGGRAAILSSTHQTVRSVVALNPWMYPHDGNDNFEGREFLIVHGDSDRIADPGRAASAARNIARTARVGLVSVRGAKHAMLRRHGVFTSLAADFAASTLLGSEPSGALAELRQGEFSVTV